MKVRMGRVLDERLALCARWPGRFPPEQWAMYKAVIGEAQARKLRFAIGGGLAAATYAGQWRDTKDIDLYIRKQDRDEVITMLTELGLEDYFDQKAYDRNWIYRSWQHGAIVDAMWAMANQRASVDDHWFSGPEVRVENLRFRLVPPEEMIWSKLYVLQRDRSDWPDVLAMLYSIGSEINWHRLIERLTEDSALLGSILTVFAWICPARARELPDWIWGKLRVSIPEPVHAPASLQDRARLLDSRPWFGPTEKGCQPGGDIEC